MCLKKAVERLAPLKHFAEHALLPIVLLAMRLKVGGDVFVRSGKLKLGYVLHGQTDTLYFLFEDYKVPLLPPHVAAWMGMMGELGFGLSVAFGFLGRLGALGLIFMSAVIYHTDGNKDAIYWALICAAIATYGPGKWSVDGLLCKWMGKKKEA